MSLILMSAPVIQPVIIFAVYTSAMNQTLDTATAFTTIALFNILRFPFAVMPMGFLQYMNCKVASERMSKLLAKKTLKQYISQVPSASPPSTSAKDKSVEDLENDQTLHYSVRDATFG